MINCTKKHVEWGKGGHYSPVTDQYPVIDVPVGGHYSLIKGGHYSGPGTEGPGTQRSSSVALVALSF